MKKTLNSLMLLIAVILMLPFSSLRAQRKMEKLDRGVVAVRNSSSNYFVSWRLLATDPEDVKFNLYVKKLPSLPATKLNATPLSVTNFQTASGAIGNGSQVYVTTVVNGVESAPGSISTVNAAGFNTYRSTYMDISFDPAKDGLALQDYQTKYCWPVDLDGDGEYDYVVDRLSKDRSKNYDKVQGYLRDGTLLWTIEMGPNCQIDYGSADMVTAYDMDCDGKGDVVIKTTDGTRFANGTYLGGATNPDIDGDGIVNYEIQSKRNPQYHITVVDGMTGNEKTSIAMDYSKTIYTRDNRASFMGDEYNKLVGHMGILYLDGKHPSVGYIYMVRTQEGHHIYYVSAWGYNNNGLFEHKYTWSRGSLDAAEAHGLRVADTDFDGRDEMLDIGYGIRHDGTLAFNVHISHGDRFHVTDINPERPGLETFAIQQNASSMLGQILYDAATGEPIKKWYLSSVGDVGRGISIDIDSTRLGCEMWSTMSNIYDAKGNILYEGSTPWPYEGVWWDGELDREMLCASDGSGYNADVRKYSPTSHSFGSRLIEFAKMTNWQLQSMNGVRPLFFGDIAGDWREEVILAKRGSVSVTLKDVNGNDSIGSVGTCPGMVAFSTDYPTDKRLYCLMQNPAYRMQCTAKGYYQASYPDYYLGYNMPQPPVAPVQKAKLTWASGSAFDKTASTFVLEDEKTTSTFADGDDVMFDISGNNSSAIQLTSDLAPSKIWAMNPKGKDYTLAGAGKLTGAMELVKSQNGTFTLNGNHTYTGKTLVSEGALVVNGSLASQVDIRAKGTLSGNAILNGGITLNPGLNQEGGRLAPGNGLASGKLGKITINGNVNMPGKSNVHIDILPHNSYKNDSLEINGDLTVSGVVNVVVNTESGILSAGSYSLVHWTGTLTGSVSNFAIEGISGLPMSLLIENNTLKLVVNAVRAAGNVTWSGKESQDWDFMSANFKQGNNLTFFVNGDSVQFNDSAAVKTVTLIDNMTVANTTISNNSPYVLKGTGGISGSGDLVKSGRGLLDIQTTNNSYTGKTILNNTVVQVASLADAGTSSSLGAAAADAGNITMTDSRLIVNAVSTNSNRGITLIGNDTINVPKSNGVVALNGLLTGSGKLVATGAGQLNISGTVANTYTGGTLISGVKLSLGTLLMNANGCGSGPVTLENGATLRLYYNTGYSSYQTSTWTLNVPAGNTATLITSGRCTIAGSISGGGTLTYNTTYVRADLSANCINFTGKLIATGSDFRITNNANGLPAANVQLSDNVGMGYYASVGASSTSTSGVVKIGSLSGVSTSKVNGGTWQVGFNNQDAVFNGIFASGATVTKVGTGAWTLTGASTNTSTFTINGGKVIAANTTGSVTGTGFVNVNNGATLAGTGIIGGAALINTGAILMPGNTAVGTLSFGSTLKLNAGSITSINVSGTSNSKLAVTGVLTLGGTLQMNSSIAYQAGKSYTIFTSAAGPATGSFTAISPATPGEGLQWNTSRIAEGIISVDVAAGVDAVKESAVTVYPNPVRDICYVTIGAFSSVVKVELINEVGTIVSTQVADALAGRQEINMNGLYSGVYFVKVTADGKSFLRKVIKL